MPRVDGPLVSVVIPAYNAAAFLGEAIESALSQTHSPLEVIVVDDGSTDATAEIAVGYEGVRLLRRPHCGQAAARNSGVEAAQGEVLAFHDADDVMLPDRIRVQLEQLHANPPVDLVLGGQDLIVEEGAAPPAWHPASEFSFRAAQRQAGAGGRGNVHTMTLLVRREVFGLVGPFDENLRHGEDLDWLLRAREAGLAVSVLQRPLIRRRVHQRSLTQDEEAERRGLAEVFHARIRRKRAAS
jgi:glycosyltransferase involved in cell wall biosynthesis